MNTGSIDSEIKHYLPLLGMEEKKSLLSVIKSFLHLHKTPERISIEQYNKEIEDAEKRIESGHYTSQEDAEKQAESW
jgi:hypothetical protein